MTKNKRFRVECDCGSSVYAENEEEAIRKFMEQHNFPFEGTRDYWDEFKGYAEEFVVVRENDWSNCRNEKKNT